MAGSTPSDRVAPAWPAPAAFEGRPDFQALLLATLEAACRRGCRELNWVSPDFEGWPLGSRAVVELLTDWARPGRVRLRWIGDNFERLRRDMPRLVLWRQQFSHVIECRRPEDAACADLPNCLLVDGEMALMLYDQRHWRGRLSAEPRDLRACQEQIDALLQRSTETFPITTMGI